MLIKVVLMFLFLAIGYSIVRMLPFKARGIDLALILVVLIPVAYITLGFLYQFIAQTFNVTFSPGKFSLILFFSISQIIAYYFIRRILVLFFNNRESLHGITTSEEDINFIARAGHVLLSLLIIGTQMIIIFDDSVRGI